MFIEITTPSNPLRTENFLRPYKRGEKEFTPEVAREILSMTNHPRNIKDTLQLISNQQDQAPYKEIILSVFDHREQPADTIIFGKKLAVANGFETELNTIINNDPLQDTVDGILYASASNQIAACICTKEKTDLSRYPDNITLYCTSDNVNLSHTNLASVKSLKFKEGSSVDLSDCHNLPAELDFSMCNSVDLYLTDLAPVKSLKFKEGSSVDLSDCDNLPAELDISMCNKVLLFGTDLAPVKSLKFKEGSEIDVRHCRNLPVDLDVSMCKNINLGDTDLAPVKFLKFKEGSTVDLSSCQNIPADLDVSMCNSVDLYYANLASVKSLKFKEGSSVFLVLSQNLPAELDFSMCNTVNLHAADLSSVASLKFKNKQQQQESKAEIPENWQGKITYADDMQPNTLAYAKQNVDR